MISANPRCNVSPIHPISCTNRINVLHCHTQASPVIRCASAGSGSDIGSKISWDPTSTSREDHRTTRRSCILVPAVTAAALLLTTPKIVSAKEKAAKATSASSGDWSSPGLSVPVDESAPKFSKTASGVRIQELAIGSGPAAAMGDAVLFDYVLRRANGYFIYATVEGVSFQPKDVPVGPVRFILAQGDLIPGLQEVLVGMQPGSKRRALIPPNVGYTDQTLQPQPPTFGTQRQLLVHSKEPLLFEVSMLRVRDIK